MLDFNEASIDDWLELDSNLNSLENIAENMIKMHWDRFLLEWKDAVR